MGQTGLTLVELTIVIVVVSIAALFFSGMFVEAVRTYEFVDREKVLLQEARYAEERVERELQGVTNASSWLRLNRTSVAFRDRDSTTVEIGWDGVRGAPLTLRRGDVARPLAEHVDSFALSYYRGDGAPVGPSSGARAASTVRRVSLFLRLARDGHSVDAVGAATLRAL